MNIAIYKKSDIDSVAIAWKQLESEVTNVGLTVSWDWVQTWLEVYGELVEYHFAVGAVEDKPVGVALLTQETHRPLPLPVKAFHIGANGEPIKDVMQMTHNTILAKNEFKAKFVEELIEVMLKTFSVEEIVFDDFSSDDGELVLSILRNKKYKVSVKKEPTLYFDFDVIKKTDTSLLSNLSPSMHKAIKRSLKAFDDVSVEWAESVKEGLDILNELIYLYEAKWRKFGRDGVFASSYYTDFQKRVIKKLLSKKQVVLIRVKSKKYGTLGCSYLLVDKGIAHYIQVGHQGTFHIPHEVVNPNKLRAGHVTDTLGMEECLKRGLKGVNYSVGLYPYKKKLTNAESEIMNISVRRSIKPVIRDRIFDLYKLLDAEKQTPFYIKFLRTLFK